MESASDMAASFHWRDLAILIAAVGSVLAACAAIWSAHHQWRQARASDRLAEPGIHAEVQGKAPWLWVILHIQAKDESFVLEAITARKPAGRLMIHPEISGTGTSVHDVSAIRRSTDFTRGARTITVNRTVPANHRAEVGFWYHWPPRRRLISSLSISRRLMSAFSSSKTRSWVSLNLTWKNRTANTSPVDVAIQATERQLTVQK